MPKPFSLQAPEEVAKEYGGNKQKIMAAAQTGIVDPTAAVLAGMFIDRMRNAVQAEQGSPPTIAQQVMSPPQGPPPGGPGGPPPGGLPPGGGAPPPGMGGGPPPPEMTGPPPGMGAPPPDMGGPPPEMAGPPPGMAEGGLAQLEVPDDMYEPSYEAGGLVSFAGGGGMDGTDFLNYLENKESGGQGDYDKQGRPLRNKRSGAMYRMQVLPSTAHKPGYGVKPAANESPEEYNRVGRELALAWQAKYGDAGGAAAYNMGPGAYEAHMAGRRGMPTETRNYISGLGGSTGSMGGVSSKVGAQRGEDSQDVTTAVPEGRSFDEVFNEMQGTIGPRGTKARDEYLASLQTDPETAKKERSSELWGAFSRMMFKAATSGQGLIGGAAEAAPEELDNLTKSAKERKADKREALKAAAGAEGEDYGDRVNTGKLAAEMMSDQEKTRQGALNRRAEIESLRDKIEAEAAQAGLNRAAQIEAARIGAITDTKTIMQWLDTGTDHQKQIATFVLSARASAKEPKPGLLDTIDAAEGGGATSGIKIEKIG